MEFDGYLSCPFDLKKAHRPKTIEGNLCVGCVVADNDPVAVGKVNNPLKEILTRDSGRRVVRIVNP